MLVTCPACKTKVPWEENPWRPFCSERCKMSDLGSWAAEKYRIAGPFADVEEDEKKLQDTDQKEDLP